MNQRLNIRFRSWEQISEKSKERNLSPYVKKTPINYFSSVFEFISSFFVKDWLVKLNSTPNKLDEVDRLRLNNLLNVTSTMIIDDGTHEEYLRICKHCGKVLQQFYDQNRFRNIQKDQAILQYDVDQVFYLF